MVFDQVAFRYRGMPVERQLTGISFNIAHGKSLGVVGHTGAGKSTVSRLPGSRNPRPESVAEGARKE